MLLGHRLAYDADTMIGRTVRDQEIIAKALGDNKYLEVAVYDDDLRVAERNCYIANAVYISYNPNTMHGKTDSDEAAINAALTAGRKLHIRKEGDEIRVIDVICYIAPAVYKDKDDSKRPPSP